MTPSKLTTLQWKVTHACIYEKHKFDLVGKVQIGYKVAQVEKGSGRSGLGSEYDQNTLPKFSKN